MGYKVRVIEKGLNVGPSMFDRELSTIEGWAYHEYNPYDSIVIVSGYGWVNMIRYDYST